MPEQEGRELDAEVAEKVMGCRPLYSSDPALALKQGPACRCGVVDLVQPHGAHARRPDNGLAHYSTDIAAAWQVVEKMSGGEWLLHRKLGKWEALYWDGMGWIKGEAFTLPVAICLAALKSRQDFGKY